MNPFLLVAGAALAGGALSARWNWWRPVKAGVPILMYHKVGDPPPGSKLAKLWVSIDMFRRQLSFLKQRGYTPILFKDLYNFWDKNVALPPNPMIITFDDGYANNYQNAFPVLSEFGFRATLFVVVQTVGWDNKWHDPASETRVPMVSWTQIKELKEAGWEIGSHTMNHPRLPKIEEKDAIVEIEKSRRIIEEFLGEKPDTFAYPYGAGEDEPRIRDLVRKAGYRVAVGVHAGKWDLPQIKASPFNLPRVFVRGEETLYDFHLQLTRGQSRL